MLLVSVIDNVHLYFLSYYFSTKRLCCFSTLITLTWRYKGVNIVASHLDTLLSLICVYRDETNINKTVKPAQP